MAKRFPNYEESTVMSKPELAIIHDPRRCAGQPTVGHTRITVHGIIGRLKLYDWDIEGMMEAEQPLATSEQVGAAIAYYRQNRSEIERILDEQRRDYEQGVKARNQANDHQPGT